jgi:plasmid stability protein
MIALQSQVGTMASLTIRKLPDDVKRDLRLIAARNGRSLEEEVRRTLIARANQERGEQRESIGQMIYRMSRPGFDIPEAPDSSASFATFDE